MNTGVGFGGVLVVIATLIASPNVIGASEAGRGKAPHVDTGNLPGASEADSATWGQSFEYYGVPLAAPVYFVNFMLLYMANPNEAANMPAYRAPLPEAVSACLESTPQGCDYDSYALDFDDKAKGSKRCVWPTECQTDPEWQRLAPKIAKRPGQINEPLGLEPHRYPHL